MPLTTATSPTRTWVSSTRTKPLITSRTRFCAPNPTARPTTPAPAKIGVTSSPISVRAITATRLSVNRSPIRVVTRLRVAPAT
jgi:hypothetical protein